MTLPQDAGRLLLRTEPIVFEGNTLDVSEDVPSARQSGSSHQSESTGLFKPRRLGPSKPKAGLGFKKSSSTVRSAEAPIATAPVASSSSGGGKGQDDFRKMLGKK